MPGTCTGKILGSERDVVWDRDVLKRHGTTWVSLIIVDHLVIVGSGTLMLIDMLFPTLYHL